MSQRRFASTSAIVLKRRTSGEADRYVTLFTQEFGKLTGLAKGVRRLNSRKRSSLEPLTHLQVSLTFGYAVPIITETKVLTAYTQIRTSHVAVAQGLQVIEILDALTAEEEAHLNVYHHVLGYLNLLESNQVTRQTTLSVIKNILIELGFGYEDESELNLKEYIEQLANKPLRAKKYLLDSYNDIRDISGSAKIL